MVNRTGVKTNKEKILSPRCSEMDKSTLSVTPLRSALFVPDKLFSIQSDRKPGLADLFGYQM